MQKPSSKNEHQIRLNRPNNTKNHRGKDPERETSLITASLNVISISELTILQWENDIDLRSTIIKAIRKSNLVNHRQPLWRRKTIVGLYGHGCLD